VVSKVLESSIRDFMISHLKEYKKLIKGSEHGFTAKRSICLSFWQLMSRAQLISKHQSTEGNSKRIVLNSCVWMECSVKWCAIGIGVRSFAISSNHQ